MKAQPTIAIYDLLPDGSITLEPGAQIELTCMSGVLWITCEGNLADHFLRAGESSAISVAGVTLISALERARVAIWEKPAFLRPPYLLMTILRKLMWCYVPVRAAWSSRKEITRSAKTTRALCIYCAKRIYRARRNPLNCQRSGG